MDVESIEFFLKIRCPIFMDEIKLKTSTIGTFLVKIIFVIYAQNVCPIC